MADVTPDPHRDEPIPTPQEGVRPEADDSVVRPEENEPNGPLPGLLATAAADVQEEAGLGDEETHDDLHEVGVEAEGIVSGQIMGITVAILATVFLLGFIVYWAFYKDAVAVTESDMAGQVQLAPEQRSILAQGHAVLQNYGLSADSSYTMPIAVAMERVVQNYGGSAADSSLAGVPAMDGAATRQGFNVLPIRLGPAAAVRSAATQGARPIVEASADSAPEAEEEVGIDRAEDTADE